MKAILVVDVDEKHMLLELNDLYDRMKGRKCNLVPMPEKKEPFGYLDMGNEDGLYEKGWNDCLAEITGDYITQEEADLCGVQLWHDD